MGLRMENVLGKRIGTRLNENPHSVWSPAGSKLCPNFLQLPPGLSKSLVFHEMKPQKKTNHIYNGQLNWGPIHTGPGTWRAQIGMFFLWCCLHAVWTPPFTSTGPICLRCVVRRVPRPVRIGPWQFVRMKHWKIRNCKSEIGEKLSGHSSTVSGGNRTESTFWCLITFGSSYWLGAWRIAWWVNTQCSWSVPPHWRVRFSIPHPYARLSTLRLR